MVQDERLGRLAGALDQLRDWVERDVVPGVCAVVLADGRLAAQLAVGTASWGDGTPGFDDRDVSADTIFYLASITKPVTATAAMLLVQQGRLGLDDRVCDHLPAFTSGGPEKARVTIRQLFTHTSGLPDMLPDNVALRQRHAGLDVFVASAYRVPLLFAPGTRVSYSSAGILLLARIVEQLGERPLHQFLDDRLLGRLGVRDFALHLPEAQFPRVARLRLRPGEQPTDWDNNSTYWRRIGAPWGGIYATARDTAQIGQFFLEAGWTGGPGRDLGVLDPATARAMVQPQTVGLTAAPGTGSRWGLGWQINGGWMGAAATDATFGHIGTSGTMLWIDPPRQLVCCVLTNKLTDWTAEWQRFATFSAAVMETIEA